MIKLADREVKMLLDIINKNNIIDLTTLKLRDKMLNSLGDSKDILVKKIEPSEIKECLDLRYEQAKRELANDGYTYKEVMKSNSEDYNNENYIWALGYYFGYIKAIKDINKDIK